MRDTYHIQVVEGLADMLDGLGIAYAIGGSLASSVYGASRFTQDADITVQPFARVADRFYEMVQKEFYISEQAMHQALDSCGSFNIVHFETAFKIDIFVQGPDEFEQGLLARSQEVKLSDSSRRRLRVVSAEDIVLLKLRWFRESGGTSQRQWDDVLGVLRVRRPSLDFEYLTESARKLSLVELLDRAIAEADA